MCRLGRRADAVGSDDSLFQTFEAGCFDVGPTDADRNVDLFPIRNGLCHQGVEADFIRHIEKGHDAPCPGIGRVGHNPGTDSRTGRILFGFRQTMEAVIHGAAQFLFTEHLSGFRQPAGLLLL